MKQRIFSTFLFLLLATASYAQKKPLDHSVYDGWKSLSNIRISKDGKILTALIQPQEGDTTLWVKNLSKNRALTIERVKTYVVSPDGIFTVGLVKAPFAERREARIKKKKKEDLPKDSLVIVDNRTLAVRKIAGVKAFKAPEEMSGHIAYTVTAPKDTAKKDKKEKDLLILHNLITQYEDTIRNAKDHLFNKFGNAFAVNTEPDKKDTTRTPEVLFFDLKNDVRQTISKEKAEYKSFAFDEQGEQLVYLATKDTSKIEQKAFEVRYFKKGADSAVVIAGKSVAGLPAGWIFNEFSTPRFSKNGERIVIGAAPKQAPKDTTIIDFEMAKLDIWHWKDPLIQPQQLVELRHEQSRTYTGIIDPKKPNAFLSVATEEMPFCSIANENNGRFALLGSDRPYRLETQWDVSPRFDAWTYDFETDRLQPVARAMGGRPTLSSQGNYTIWWDAAQRHWFAFDNHARTTVNLTKDIGVNFWNEEHNTPSLPGSYGLVGWGENDEYVLLNDAFDIWKIDPKGIKKPENFTLGKGRSNSLVLRYVRTDPEKRFFAPNDLLLLSAWDKRSKENGFYTLKTGRRNLLQKRLIDTYTFPSVVKAKEADVFAFLKGNFQTSPDLYVTRDFWKSTDKLTDINPQMRDYRWGTAELFAWTSFAGIPLQGIVYKPEGFDPQKKYPVMIYFYEKHSDELYRYYPPAPSRSIINIPFFVSRGYVVFVPDIHYTVGHPGEDAYNAIVAGAEALARNAWIDKANMAIQGQSWGGYQVSYLVTRTDMFKAAGAGAPVSNMTSAYGGIRWESGRSRQFQYEQTQSRIGATMQDSLNLYIANSPVFFADKVRTPLLIMHNDKDGAVPWYQGIEYFMTLRRMGKPVWMLQYNNEAHNLRERRNCKDLSIRLQQFFDHYLKGAPAPVWMTKGLPATEKGKSWGYELDTDK